MSELLVVRSGVKKATKMNVAGNFADALSKIVEMKIKKAEERATGNGRKTLKPIDL